MPNANDHHNYLALESDREFALAARKATTRGITRDAAGAQRAGSGRAGLGTSTTRTVASWNHICKG